MEKFIEKCQEDSFLLLGFFSSQLQARDFALGDMVGVREEGMDEANLVSLDLEGVTLGAGRLGDCRARLDAKFAAIGEVWNEDSMGFEIADQSDFLVAFAGGQADLDVGYLVQFLLGAHFEVRGHFF